MDWLLSEEELWGWVKKVKELSKNKTKQNKTKQPSQTTAWWLPEGNGWGELEEGKRDTMVMEGDLTWGSEHNIISRCRVVHLKPI